MQRDLKPSNLLLSDDGPAPTLKIADFGIAAQVEPEGESIFFGVRGTSRANNNEHWDSNVRELRFWISMHRRC